MRKYHPIIFFLFFFPLLIAGQNIPDPMEPKRAVNDFSGLLSRDEQARLEQKLRNYNDTTSSGLVIVTVNSTNGMDISQYTTELAHKWGVGQAEYDNGLVILVAKNDRKVFIATGYGLEGAVPDALAKRIVEQQITPRFREGNYYRGLDDATDTIMKLASGEYTAKDVSGGESSGAGIIPVILIILFLIIFPVMQRRAFRKHHLGSGKRPTGWLSTLLLMSAMGGGRGRSYGDFNRGGGVFGGGGGGGGGFGGFGGGGFGGGGAGGSW